LLQNVGMTEGFGYRAEGPYESILDNQRVQRVVRADALEIFLFRRPAIDLHERELHSLLQE